MSCILDMFLETSQGKQIFAAATEHQCDVIVATSMGNTHSLDVAEELGILCMALKFCPDIDGQVPTGSFPPSGYPNIPGPANFFLHMVENLRTVAAVFRGGFIPKVIEFRTALGLPSQEIPFVMEVPTYSPYRQVLQANQPSLYAFSRALVDVPPEYQSWHFVPGFFAPQASSDTDLTASLQEFLKVEAPICIAFGSMTLARSAPFEERAVEAARRQGKPVLIVDPDAQSEGVSPDDPSVFRLRSAPYSALFPRCCLVVHHGGAGTLQDCLVAGTAQLVAPVLSWSDQPFWAAALEEKGLGVALGGGGEAPEAGSWDAAYQRCFQGLQEFQQAARALSDAMAKEGGVDAACQVIEDALLGA